MAADARRLRIGGARRASRRAAGDAAGSRRRPQGSGQVAHLRRRLQRPSSSPLTQITPQNVGQLSAQWTFQTGALGNFQTTPIVIDGIIYATGWNNNAWAIDARTGRVIWRYRRNLPEAMHLCCGAVNRGFGGL